MLYASATGLRWITALWLAPSRHGARFRVYADWMFKYPDGDAILIL